MCISCVDTLVGVETLVRVSNRNKKAIRYGTLPSNSSDVSMGRDVMLKKYAADTDFFLFLVYGKEKQFWVNTGNLETMQEWMVISRNSLAACIVLGGMFRHLFCAPYYN